jgi:hypothetical protein
MSKEKATRVIVHRIEFQQKERELIEGLALAYSINKIATPTVALMSDVSGMIVLAGMLGAIGIAIDVSGLNSESAMAEVIDRFKEGFRERIGRESLNEQGEFNNPLLSKFGIFGEVLQYLGNLQGDIIRGPN